MRKLLLATAAVLATAGLAQAQTNLDPLHGMVCTGVGTGCSNAADNGSFTPIAEGSNFAFSVSPGPATGNLDLVILVPTNTINVNTFNLPSLTDNGSVLGGVNVFSRTNLLTSGNGSSIASYLGVPNAASYSPTDNFANASAGEGVENPGFTGSFLAFSVTLNGINLNDTSSTTSLNDFQFGSNLPAGTVVLGLFAETAGPQPGNFIGTAASADLVITPTASVPGPIVGAGLPGLVSGLLAMLGLGRLRRRRNAT